MPVIDYDKINEEIKKLQEKIFVPKSKCETFDDSIIPKDLEGCIDENEIKKDRVEKLKIELDKIKPVINLEPNAFSDSNCFKELNTQLSSASDFSKALIDKNNLLEISAQENLENFYFSFCNIISNLKLLRKYGSESQKKIIITKYSDFNYGENISIASKNFKNNITELKNSIDKLNTKIENVVNLTNVSIKDYEKFSNKIFTDNKNSCLSSFYYFFNYKPDEEDIEKLKVFSNTRLNFISNSFFSFKTFNLNSNRLEEYLKKNNVTFNMKDIIKNIDDNFLILNNSYNNFNDFLNNLDINYVKKKIEEKFYSIEVCKHKIEKSDLKSKDYIKDDNKIDFSDEEDSDFSKLKYWLEFSKYLNMISLLPQYWTVGIITPIPIRLPIIWIPIVCIKTPVNIIVIWITINGIVVFPVIFELRFQPLGDSDSVLTTLFKGGNKKIRSKTGSKKEKLPISKNIDTNPTLSKSLPLTQDDLPIIERLSITNLPYVVFLNQWCSTASPSMGLI